MALTRRRQISSHTLHLHVISSVQSSPGSGTGVRALLSSENRGGKSKEGMEHGAQVSRDRVECALVQDSRWGSEIF